MGLKKAFFSLAFDSGVPHEGMDGVCVYVFLGGKPPSILSPESRSSWRRDQLSQLSAAAQPEGRKNL